MSHIMRSPRILVVGAGAFGGWTGLALRRLGADVTVIDAWGPGHVRASSGGETRVIRATYGSRVQYTKMTMRALVRWRELEAQLQRLILHRTGVLWLFDDSTPARAFAQASAAALAAHGASLAALSAAEAAARYPQINFRDVASVMFEAEAGYLMARRACEDVIAQFQREGGTYRLAAAEHPLDGTELRAGRLTLVDGSRLEADVFVLAAGPWLASLAPDVLGHLITPTRQEVYYFGTPAGDARFTDAMLPAWIDFGAAQIYGIPGNAYRGFKIADDRAGAVIDPTTAERDVTPSGVALMRDYLARRFPALATAPLVGTEVCQYQASPDADLIVDRHPAASNVWLAGGGSGHGFKLGPAVGELVASSVMRDDDIDPCFALARFARPPAEGWQEKWT